MNDVKSENPITQNSQQRKSFYCYCVIFNHISLCGIAFTEKKCSVSTVVAEFSNFLLDRRTDNFSNLHLEWVKITDFHWYFFSLFLSAVKRGENNMAWLKSLQLQCTVDFCFYQFKKTCKKEVFFKNAFFKGFFNPFMTLLNTVKSACKLDFYQKFAN